MKSMLKRIGNSIMRIKTFTIILTIMITLFTLSSVLFSQQNNYVQAQLGFDDKGTPYIVTQLSFKEKNPKIDNYYFETETTIKVGEPIINGTTYSTTIINGVQSTSLTATVYFPIFATKEGEQIVPSLIINAGGKTYKTTSLKAEFFATGKDTFSARETNQRSNLTILLKLSTDTKTAFPQQAILIRVDIYLSAVSGYKNIEPLLDLTFIKDIGESNIIKESPKINSSEISHIPVQGTKLSLDFALSGSKEIDGTLYSIYSGWFKVFAKESGDLILYSSRLDAVYKRGNGFFDFDMDSKTFTAYSEPITIKIKDFPKQSQPDSFNGAVGRYTISSKIDSSEIRIGEPILLEVTIEGDGIVQNIKRPDLFAIPEFNNNFKLTKETGVGEVKGNTITYKYTIRATNENVKNIPKIPFSFFNVDKEIYDTVYSNEIPITISHSKVLTSDDIISSNANTPSIDKQEITASKGILSNYSGYDALTTQQVNFIHFLWVLLFPIAYVICFIVVQRKRIINEDVAIKRSKEAKKKAEKYLMKAKQNVDDKSFYQHLAEGLMTYISDKFNKGQGEITASEIDDMFNNSKIPEKTREEIQSSLKEIFKTCEIGRFASANLNDKNEKETLIDKARKVINTIEPLRKL